MDRCTSVFWADIPLGLFSGICFACFFHTATATHAINGCLPTNCSWPLLHCSSSSACSLGIITPQLGRLVVLACSAFSASTPVATHCGDGGPLVARGFLLFSICRVSGDNGQVDDVYNSKHEQFHVHKFNSFVHFGIMLTRSLPAIANHNSETLTATELQQVRTDRGRT